MDVALYKCGCSYVLHRVIRVKDGYYLIRGDNTYALKTVPESAVIGVLTGFQRNGRQHSVKVLTYRFYARFWNGLYPLSFLYVGFRRAAVRFLQKPGILPMIKKVLRCSARTE